MTADGEEEITGKLVFCALEQHPCFPVTATITPKKRESGREGGRGELRLSKFPKEKKKPNTLSFFISSVAWTV